MRDATDDLDASKTESTAAGTEGLHDRRHPGVLRAGDGDEDGVGRVQDGDDVLPGHGAGVRDGVGMARRQPPPGVP